MCKWLCSMNLANKDNAKDKQTNKQVNYIENKLQIYVTQF